MLTEAEQCRVVDGVSIDVVAEGSKAKTSRQFKSNIADPHLDNRRRHGGYGCGTWKCNRRPC